MSKYTTYLRNEIPKIKAGLAENLGDSFIEPMFREQLERFEESLAKSIEADDLNTRAKIAFDEGDSELCFKLSLTARDLIKL